jgi:hypothetical protein
VVVEHIPHGEPLISSIVDVLTSNEVIEMLRESQVELNWENGGPTDASGSLRFLLDLRTHLVDALTDAGAADLVPRHRFCLDTGHLLYWKYSNPRGPEAAEQEIQDCLPLFAEELRTYHLHANNGCGDHHLVPFASDLPGNPNPRRVGYDDATYAARSQEVIGWLQMCRARQRLEGVHWHVEALSLPFSLAQIATFGRKLVPVLSPR